MAKIANHSLEKYIVKCMYNRPSTIVEIVQTMKPSDFTNIHYRNLFSAIKHLYAFGDVNSYAIMQHFEMKNKEIYDTFKANGGAVAIEKVLIDDTIPENPQLEEQMTELKQLSYRRKAIEVSNKIRIYAENNGDIETGIKFKTIEELDEIIKENVYSLAESLQNKNTVDAIGSSVKSLREEIKAGATMGIDISGYWVDGKKIPFMPKLNTLIKRLRDGALYVFGAPEKCGKSTFLLDIAWFVADKLNLPVAYGDTEMTTDETLLRICSKLSGIEEDKIADNMLTPEEEVLVNNAWDRIENVPFYHFNCNMLSNAELESKVKLLQLQHGIRLFVYDYVKVQSHEVGAGRPDLVLAGKLDTLKEKICKQCNIPVLTSGQMYARNDDRGQINKFAETSHFTKLADVICRLDRVNEEEMDIDLLGCTHYIELITGRKVRTDRIGEKIGFKFNMPIHDVREM